MDRAGMSAARWFDGFGFFANIRQPLRVGRSPVPFHPDQPIITTLYVPFPKPELALEAQGTAARQQLYSTPFSEYERQTIEQFQAMFGSYGFDARRDVAGIISNR